MDEINRLENELAYESDKRDGQVTSELKTLSQCIEELEKGISHLQERLSGLTRDDMVEKKESPKAEMQLVPVAQLILERRNQIEFLVNKIGSLTKRIEL